jgi:hypothetical protein
MQIVLSAVLILGLVGGGFAVAANMLALMMIGQINQNLPEGKRLSYVWWGIGIRKMHRRLFPKSMLVLLFDICGILAGGCFVAAGWIQITSALASR